MKLFLKYLSFLLLTSYLFLSCQKELSCENCKGDNLPPIAVAGPIQAITLSQDSILLDGRASSDPDGTIINYNWTKIAGPSSYLFVSPSSSLCKVRNLEAGEYHFVLLVTDDGGLVDADTTIIFVDTMPVNHAPIANSGIDINLTIPVSVSNLDGSGSTDPDNNIVSYAWTKISGPSVVTIQNPVNVQTPIGGLQVGQYRFELVVTDAGGLFSKDTVLVTVNQIPGIPPVAVAGNDLTQIYNLQTCTTEPSSLTLDGSASFDPDGTIVHYQWSQISGYGTDAVIANPSAPITTISNLSSGHYEFRLLVTDNNGATDDDTVLVQVFSANRPSINAQLVPVGMLSEQRKVSAVATLGNKVFFAGGTAPPTGPGPHFSSRVDIYDMSTNSWSTENLSQARWGLTAIGVGNKVYFAGGTAINGGVGQTSRIDVYDVVTGFWTTLELPQPGHYSSIAFGTKLFFAGGTACYIYNTANNTWSTKTLSQPRYSIAATNVQGKLYFAGGASTITGGVPSSAIDIYDPASNQWSVSTLSKEKSSIAGLGMRGKVLWSGGITITGKTNEIEILDVNFQTTTFYCLQQASSFSSYSIAKKDNSVVFFVWDGAEKNKFDIFDAVNETWSIGLLNESITPSIIITANNTIYVAGATLGGNGFYDQVWRLDF